MERSIGAITLMIDNYDKAIAYYVDKLNFVLIKDIRLDQHKRWVVIAPLENATTQIILTETNNKKQTEAVGNQTGGPVFLFLNTDDFWRDYNQMKSKNVIFLEEPRNEAYGIVVVFEDLYGNKWDLIQHK